jgi:hypothetical protein
MISLKEKPSLAIESNSTQTRICGDKIDLSAAPFHTTVSKFHYCALEPVVTKNYRSECPFLYSCQPNMKISWFGIISKCRSQICVNTKDTTYHVATCLFLSSVSSKLRVDSRKQAPSNNAHLYEFNISKPKGKQ